MAKSNRYGYIYMITNTVNNMKYIGKHKSRRFDDFYMGSGVEITKAEEEYGIENFKKELLEWCENSDILDRAELRWIETYDAKHSEEFYNRAGRRESRTDIQRYTEDEIAQIKEKNDTINKTIKPKKHWYTNGEVQIITEECPKGFIPGQLDFAAAIAFGKTNFEKSDIVYMGDGVRKYVEYKIALVEEMKERESKE